VKVYSIQHQKRASFKQTSSKDVGNVASYVSERTDKATR